MENGGRVTNAILEQSLVEFCSWHRQLCLNVSQFYRVFRVDCTLALGNYFIESRNKNYNETKLYLPNYKLC